MKILLAEDNPIFSHLLRRHLANWGHVVVHVENGRAAWEQFERERFPIVISDWMMPEMDGIELVRRIRAAELPEYVYIVLLTARTDKQDLVAGMEAGADDFLAKPFDLNELRVRLRAGERIIELERTLARQNEQLQIANRRMKRDLDAAARVQRSLLPAKLPEFATAEFAWAFEPCDELAGDILNVFRLDDRHAAFYLLDVSGHGVGAALLSVTLSRVLTPVVAHSSALLEPSEGTAGCRVVPPREVAERLNRQFPMDLQTGQYFTLFYGVLDLDTRALRYVSAGHPGPLVVRPNGSTSLLDVTGPPIGMVPEIPYEEGTIGLASGDRVLVYSDGIPEAVGPGNETFGMERFVAQATHSRSQPLTTFLERLLDAIRVWVSGHPPSDDVSCLALQMK